MNNFFPRIAPVLRLRTALLFPTALLLLLIASIFMHGCSGGGSDDSQTPLLTNACSQLGLNTRIINGTECLENGSPIVKIIINLADGSQGICSGTLITPTHVLTAAHCFFSSVGPTLVSVAGQTKTATHVTSHPAVLIDNQSGRIENDAAIVELRSPFSGASILPVVISRQPQSGDTISIFGYGKDEVGQFGTLRSGEMRIHEVSTTHIRAKYEGEGSNTCFGDSGGPAILTYMNNAGVEVDGIIGLVSSGILPTCLAGDETFFTNVTTQSLIDFVTSVVPSASVS